MGAQRPALSLLGLGLPCIVGGLIMLSAPLVFAAEPPAQPAALDFGIATVLGASAIGLVAFGAVEFMRAQEHLAFCRDLPIIEFDSRFAACSFDPPTLAFVSAGLSWGLSIPLLAGSGLLFARGAAKRRAAKRGPAAQLTLQPYYFASGGRARPARSGSPIRPRTRSGGALLTLRF